VNRLPLIVTIACLIAAAGIAGITWAITREPAAGAVTGSGVSGPVSASGRAAVGGPFRLVDQDGRRADESLLKGKWTVVFFGFTYCPDVCPTTLQALAAAKRQMGRPGEDLQVVFITVDPERDTPEALKAYLRDAGLPDAVGLTGTPEQVAAAAKAYRIYYARKGEGADYTMDHSTAAYLMNPRGEFETVLPYGMSPAQKAEIILRAQAGRRSDGIPVAAFAGVVVVMLTAGAWLVMTRRRARDAVQQ